MGRSFPSTVADERNAIERRSYQGIADTIV